MKQPAQDRMSRKSLRQLLLSMLKTDSDHDAFCGDRFPLVYARYTNNMDRIAKINLLLDHASGEAIVDALRDYDKESFLQSVSLLKKDEPAEADPDSSELDRYFQYCAREFGHMNVSALQSLSREPAVIPLMAELADSTSSAGQSAIIKLRDKQSLDADDIAALTGLVKLDPDANLRRRFARTWLYYWIGDSLKPSDGKEIQ